MKRLGSPWKWILAVSGILLLSLAVPASPLYFPKLLVPSLIHDGRSASYWLKELQSKDAESRGKALFAMGAIGPEASMAIPALKAILVQDEDTTCRRQASLALAKMTPASGDAVEELAKALEDEDFLVRFNSALALSRLGEKARPAVPALIRAMENDRNHELLGSTTHSLHDTLALALGRASAGTSDGVATLINSLDAPSSYRYPRTVAQALGEIGPEARQAIPLLREMLGDEDTDARTAATEAMIRIAGDLPKSVEKTPDPELPEQERKYLWEIEHHGNQLNKHGFNELARALKAGDTSKLNRLLAEGFSATDFRDPKRIHASGPAEVERLEDAGKPAVSLDRLAFVSRLMELRKQFHGEPQVKLALMTLSPVQRSKLDGPWQGKAQLRLVGEHKPGAPAEMVVVMSYEVPRPTPESLSKPGWLRAAGFKQIVSGKAPSYLFVEKAKNRGLDASKLHDNWNSPAFQVSTGGVYVTDFDRDGILDVLITDFNGSALYRGTAQGVFENVTDRLGGSGDEFKSRVAAWIDIDGDGWEDLLIGDRVLRNDSGARFQDYTSRARIKLPIDITNIVIADYDRDGKLDVYMTRSARLRGRSWLEGKSSFSRGNVLLRNKGDWVFEDVTRTAGVSGDRRSTFTAAWLDANNDGWPDLHVINEFGDGVLLVNQGDGKFRPHRLADRPADFGTMGMAVGDVDNDGNIDIYCANMYSKAGTRVIGNLSPDAFSPEIFEKMRRFVAGSQLHLNRGDLKFEQVGIQRQVAAVGWAYGAALADLDNDGFLDIYGTAGYVSRDRNEPDG